MCIRDRTYTGTAQGIGEVSVTLTVEDGKITAAEVVGENETKGIGYGPCADGTYADAIVAAQGVDFDSISGATVTSNAVKDATKKAMAAAGLIEAEDTLSLIHICSARFCGPWFLLMALFYQRGAVCATAKRPMIRATVPNVNFHDLSYGVR